MIWKVTQTGVLKYFWSMREWYFGCISGSDIAKLPCETLLAHLVISLNEFTEAYLTQLYKTH